MSDSTDDIIISPADGQAAPGVTFEPPIINSDLEPFDEEKLYTPADPAPVVNVQPQFPVIKPVPNTGRGPVGNYYAEIRWENGFDQWPLVRFSTPMDGSCLFHAISNSFFAPYHTETLHGQHIPRIKMVASLRRELSEKLASQITTDTSSPTHYDILNGGNTSAFAEAVPEFELKYMQSQLDSTTPIGYGYMEFIGNALNKDIYILEALRHDIYVTDELPLTIKGDRNSIVLYYMNGHYELVGIQNPDNTFDTHFTPDHSFIRFLYNRVCQIIGRT